MLTYENGKFVPWHPDMIASKGSVLHGRNSAFVPPPRLDRPDRPHTVRFSDKELRAIWLVNWAAECHTHREKTRMPLGNLPHSVAEVDEARETVRRLFGGPLRHEDEGVKVRSKQVH